MSASVEGFKAKIYLGIEAQRGKRIRISEAQDAKITSYVTDYIQNLYRLLSAGKSSTGKFTYTFLGGTPVEFKARISGEGNVGPHLVELREKAGLRRVSNGVSQVFKDVKLAKGKILFDISHMGGSTIAEQYARAVLAKYENAGLLPVDKQSYETLKVAINYNPKAQTIGTVEVEDTFWYLNQSTTEEAFITRLLERAVGDYVLDNDDFTQGKVDYLSRDLASIAKKRGGKVTTQPTEPKARRAKDSATIKHKAPKKPTFSIEQMSKRVEVLERVGDDTRNWSLLLPKINALLHDAVKANMVSPRLVYRTGEFAQSVRVTKVEATEQGYPAFSADYQRDPYQVFDRVMGGAPWNIPTRDPKDLINQAVRDVMRTLAVGRFYVKVPRQGV